MTTAYPATTNQLGFIRSLVEARQSTCGVSDVDAFIDTIRTERLTKDGASKLIDTLLKMPVDPQPVPEPNPNAAPDFAAASAPIRKGEPFNRFAGQCVLCGQTVHANEGTYRGRPGAWETLHLPGGCPAVDPETAVKTADSKDTASWTTAKAALQEFPAGYYAVPAIHGNNDLTFFAVKVNKGFYNPSKKGEHYFEHIVGGKNPAALKVGPAFILKALEAARTVGIEDAGLAYAQNFECCWRCGRQLTVAVSRHRGLGPECAQKV